jgi:hypothetical protein
MAVSVKYVTLLYGIKVDVNRKSTGWYVSKKEGAKQSKKQQKKYYY